MMTTTVFEPLTAPLSRGLSNFQATPPHAAAGCLIVSRVAEHLRELSDVAGDTGWRPLVCEDLAAALKTMCKNSIRLAVIDFEQAADMGEDLRNLAEYIKWLGGILLVVNAEPQDEAMERWARQLGVWTFLPGIHESSDLAGLLNQARDVADKLGGHSHAPR